MSHKSGCLTAANSSEIREGHTPIVKSRCLKDYTGYEPINTINSLSKPERWQPGQTVFHPGIYSSQQFLTPQMRLVTPFTFEDITQFSLDPHARMPVEVKIIFYYLN